MAKSVAVGSVWYAVSMTWISKWQSFVGFDDENTTKKSDSDKVEHPGKMDCSDIIEPFHKGKDGQIVSTMFEEMSPNYASQNVQLKKNVKEGEDYMLVDENIFNLWELWYGKLNEIKRFGIEDENGETVVELHLKVFNLYPIPNKKLFKLENMLKQTVKGATKSL